jgi:hypothetical protein
VEYRGACQRLDQYCIRRYGGSLPPPPKKTPCIFYLFENALRCYIAVTCLFDPILGEDWHTAQTKPDSEFHVIPSVGLQLAFYNTVNSQFKKLPKYISSILIYLSGILDLQYTITSIIKETNSQTGVAPMVMYRHLCYVIITTLQLTRTCDSNSFKTIFSGVYMHNRELTLIRG